MFPFNKLKKYNPLKTYNQNINGLKRLLMVKSMASKQSFVDLWQRRDSNTGHMVPNHVF